MKAKQEPIECGKFADSTHSKDGIRAGGGQYNPPLASRILSFFVNKSNVFSGFLRQITHKSRIFRRILATVSYIVSVAAAGYCVYLAVDKWGMVAYLPIVAVTFYALFMVLMLGGDK